MYRFVIPAVEEKSWGHAARLHPLMDVWLASARRGGRSSVHYHPVRNNLLYVVSGSASVELFLHGREGLWKTGAVDIYPGQSLVVDAGRAHRFTALEDLVMVEYYWSSRAGVHPAPEDDIVRLDYRDPEPPADPARKFSGWVVRWTSCGEWVHLSSNGPGPLESATVFRTREEAEAEAALYRRLNQAEAAPLYVTARRETPLYRYSD